MIAFWWDLHGHFRLIWLFNNNIYPQLNETMNELVASHQNILGQKDQQLADYQKKLESLQTAESELTKLIEEQKAKNNVSWTIYTLKSRRPHPIILILISLKILTIYFSLFFNPTQINANLSNHQDLRTKNWKLVEALQTAQSSPAKAANHSNFVVSAPTVGRLSNLFLNVVVLINKEHN